ncbi:TniQ family protein [Peribacillus sp. SCS-155]|uniref:TniQ family protein n=1 Tax=Peribacillus sedimenti TaxID=3115297 RepID=UPI0039059095
MSNPLTNRPRPYAGEMLLSYVVRVAEVNAVPVLTLLNFFRAANVRKIERDDYDLLSYMPEKILDIDKLVAAVKLDRETAQNCTFFNLLNVFSMEKNMGRLRFLKGLILDKLQFCPQCLRETNHYKLIWKIKGVSVCDSHLCKLLDACPNCNKGIFYKDISILGLCPNCQFCLANALPEYVSALQIDSNKWYIKQWEYLLQLADYKISSQELAIRILFLINERSSKKLAKEVLVKYVDLAKIPPLMQHARGTWVNKGCLHLSFVIDIVNKLNLSICDLFSTNPPQSFYKVIMEKTPPHIDKIQCLAPWCEGYNSTSYIVKCNTDSKVQKDGEVLRYYTYCSKCYCEYAINETGQVTERSHFISCYHFVKSNGTNNISIAGLVKLIGLPTEKVIRALAYLQTRGLATGDIVPSIVIKQELLERMLQSIRHEEKLTDIAKWVDWSSYRHFLAYRYHHKAMETLKNTKKAQKGVSLNKQKHALMITHLKEMIDEELPITINNVSTRLKVSPETIRKWGCLGVISEYKSLQKDVKKQKRLEGVKRKIEQFFSMEHKTMSADYLYEYIGISRYDLWKIAPDITRELREKLSDIKKGEHISEYL